MKHIKLFEQFNRINEGKSWYDFSGDKLAKEFIRDHSDKRSTTGEDLDMWLNWFATDNRIEDGIDSYLLSNIIEYLNSKGYKNIDINDIQYY